MGFVGFCFFGLVFCHGWNRSQTGGVTMFINRIAEADGDMVSIQTVDKQI